jgi:hypothetical protein
MAAFQVITEGRMCNAEESGRGHSPEMALDSTSGKSQRLLDQPSGNAVSGGDIRIFAPAKTHLDSTLVRRQLSVTDKHSIRPGGGSVIKSPFPMSPLTVPSAL